VDHAHVLPIEIGKRLPISASRGIDDSRIRLPLNLIGAVFLWAVSAIAQDYHFDGTISKPVLENYLSRSISFTELLHDDLTQPRDAKGVDPRDNLRLILDTKAKFIGRSLMLWGHENNLAPFLKTAKPFAEALHQADPDIVLQAAEFEIVTTNVDTISIPERVLVEFGQAVSNRNFRYQDMLYANGHFANHWGNGSSVPDMSRLEARMWFFFLASSYIDVGIEGFHFGQVGLMDQHEVQPERHARPDRQPGHLGRELVRSDIFVGRLPADQHHRDQRQHHADGRDRTRPLPQRQADPDRDACDENRGQRRHHRDRPRPKRRVEPPDSERL